MKEIVSGQASLKVLLDIGLVDWVLKIGEFNFTPRGDR